MKFQLTTLFLLITLVICAQDTSNSFVFTPEVMAGILAEANEDFPERNPNIQAMFNFGWEQDQTDAEWAKRLKRPRTGIGLGYATYGNNDSLGSAISLLPFIEFNAFKKERLRVQAGMGASYFTKKFDRFSNPNNRGVSTNITWSFRLFMYYKWLQTEKIDWRVGAGYFHHSNGHTRLPNQGLNSFLFSLSADIKNKQTAPSPVSETSLTRSRYNYMAFRLGAGTQVLSEAFNQRTPVYNVSGEYGWVFNNTWKLGFGAFYRYYRSYYDYISNNESLVQEGMEFESLKERPVWNASALGLFVKGEVLLNHIGLEVLIGANFHKPSYAIDWRINMGWENTPREIPEGWFLGQFNTKYEVKNIVNARLGMKYFLWSTATPRKDNLFVGLHINSNGGQADFTELSIGYVHQFNFR